jgi:hypothetical protein
MLVEGGDTPVEMVCSGTIRSHLLKIRVVANRIFEKWIGWFVRDVMVVLSGGSPDG